MIQNSKFKIQNSRSGQSLIEVLIGLAIGAILIGAASLGVAFILRSGVTNQYLQTASALNQGLVDRARSVAGAAWQDIYGLSKSTSTTYFTNASGTKVIFVEGKEGVLSNDIANGLVGYWKMDEATSTATTTTFDASGNGNHGVLTGGVTRSISACKVSNCLSFDGVNGYVNVGDPINGDLDFGTSNFSASFWIKAGSQPTNTVILGKGNENCTTAGYRFIANSGGAGGILIMFVISDGTITCSNDLTSNVTGALDGLWHHVVGVADRTNASIKIYIDGVEKSANSISLNSVSTASILTFGRNSGSAAGYFNGFLDDIHIYNRALSSDEITQLYNSNIFTRYFTVENVNRDSSGNIAASGGNDDPSTQKITSYVEWPGAAGVIGQFRLVDYVTRWSNRVFNQSDWFGGSGQDGPITDPNNKYSNATSISNPAGSIRIEGL